MMQYIDFCAHAPDAASLWADWIDAGVATAPGDLAPAYAGMHITGPEQGWQPVRPTGETDGDGHPVMEAVPGYHINVRAYDPQLIAEFTHQLEQYEVDGVTLKPLFERTHAALVFGLSHTPADPVTGFPASWCSARGVCYCDPRDIKTPANVWA